MKEGWYDSANCIARTKGVNKENGWHMTIEELNAKYGCENYEEFCKIFHEADKNDMDKYMQMLIDLGPGACEEAYRTCEMPEMIDYKIRKRIEEESCGDQFYLVEAFENEGLDKGEFSKLSHGRQVQIVYINILIIAGMRVELGLEKMSENELKRRRTESRRDLITACKTEVRAKEIELRGRRMIAKAIEMNGRREPRGRQLQQLRALGFVA